MVFKNFKLNILVRITLLILTIFILVYLLLKTAFILTPGLIIIAIALQVFSLYKYIDQSNRQLAFFFETVKNADFSSSYVTGLGKSFDELRGRMGEVITELRKAKMEREESHRYLETIVHHVNIGLITMDDRGDVSLVNPAAKRLLNISVLRNISTLGKISIELEEKIRTLRSGEKALIKIHTEQEIMQVILSAAEFKLANKNFKLISIQNLNHELEENEIQVWQKLIRVLTHEIMNSVTPMTTLADSVHEILFDNTGGKPVLRQLAPADEEDIENALTLIGQRSKGLLSFVGAYRNLTRIPVPDRKVFPVGELIKGIAQLLQNDLRNKHVTLTYTITPPGLELFADSDLVEQVLINLILNAVHAVEDRGEKRITLTAEIDTAGRVSILITDSGAGIPGDVADKIFIPFFTTKREGSGIGLSISRQIVRLHGGQLNLLRTGPEGTTFQVRI